MSYESPITVITNQLRISSEMFLGKEIIKAVQGVGVNVDKAELLRALAYDREQYQKGYLDRDNKIIRCKDCKRGTPYMVQSEQLYKDVQHGVICGGVWHDDCWFCADGVAKDINVHDKEDGEQECE